MSAADLDDTYGFAALPIARNADTELGFQILLQLLPENGHISTSKFAYLSPHAKHR